MRLRARLLILAGALVFGASGCGSENLDACQAYEAYFYQTLAQCTAGLDDGIDCPAIAGYPCPINNYFTCLQAGQTCNGENLNSNVSECVLQCD